MEQGLRIARIARVPRLYSLQRADCKLVIVARNRVYEQMRGQGGGGGGGKARRLGKVLGGGEEEEDLLEAFGGASRMPGRWQGGPVKFPLIVRIRLRL